MICPAASDRAPAGARLARPESRLHVAVRDATRFPAAARLGIEIALVSLILLFAAVLRLDGLGHTPPGLHGDEAVVGIEARRILDQGWIGLYSPLALGQPTGPIYLTALSLGLFGDSITVLRAVSALLGCATVLTVYLVTRRAVDPPTALLAAAILAFMGWHLHFSRIAFPVAAWPLAVLLAAAALDAAITRNRAAGWALGGAASGLGVYVYNAHPLPMAVLFGITLFVFARRFRAPLPGSTSLRAAGCLAAYLAGLAVCLAPMLVVATTPGSGYGDRFRETSLVSSEEWIGSAQPGGKLALIAAKAGDFAVRVCCAARFDAADGSGLLPLAPIPLILLAAVGCGLAVRQRGAPLLTISTTLVATLPAAAIITVDGAARRTFAITPCLAILAAAGTLGLWRSFRDRPGAERALAAGLLVLLVAFGALQDLYGTLRLVPRSADIRWTFATEMSDAAAYMATLPETATVYFLSDRWSVDYESRQFIAPTVSGADRSREFGDFSLKLHPGANEQVFILLGDYRRLAPRLDRLYPGGYRVDTPLSSDPPFIAYVVPGRGR